MSNWFYFEFLKYEKEENEEPEKKDDEKGEDDDDLEIEVEQNEEKSLSILDIFKKFYSSDIQVLMWNLLLCVIAVISVDFHILYSIQLFTLFVLVKLMYSIIYTFKTKYEQFSSLGFMFLLASLVFSMIQYRWFSDLEECTSYSECFFNMLNIGIRGGSGMGFGIKKIGQHLYFIEFILEIIIFILVTLILMNMLVGIIVDSFQEFSENLDEEKDIKENICYICSLHREKFEKKGIKFENHIELEHNIINYFNYMSKVDNADESDLNSIDYQVKQSIKNNRADFFPINTCLSLNSNKK